MYESVNLDVLSHILDINLACKGRNFHMGQWESACGTTHCMLGNYLFYHCRHIPSTSQRYFNNKVIALVNDVSIELGLSKREFGFLFTSHRRPVSYAVSQMTCINASSSSYKGALTRLAKFIIYKRRKKELWDDYEKARRTEGTNMFCDVNEEAKELVHV